MNRLGLAPPDLESLKIFMQKFSTFCWRYALKAFPIKILDVK